jgi:hypothetical protein
VLGLVGKLLGPILSPLVSHYHLFYNDSLIIRLTMTSAERSWSWWPP